MQKENSGTSPKTLQLRKYRAAQRRSDHKFDKKPTSRGFIPSDRSEPGKGRRYRLRRQYLALGWSKVVAARRKDKHDRYTSRFSSVGE